MINPTFGMCKNNAGSNFPIRPTVIARKATTAVKYTIAFLSMTVDGRATLLQQLTPVRRKIDRRK